MKCQEFIAHGAEHGPSSFLSLSLSHTYTLEGKNVVQSPYIVACTN
jgi:hypothetical protein